MKQQIFEFFGFHDWINCIAHYFGFLLILLFIGFLIFILIDQYDTKVLEYETKILEKVYRSSGYGVSETYLFLFEFGKVETDARTYNSMKIGDKLMFRNGFLNYLNRYRTYYYINSYTYSRH